MEVGDGIAFLTERIAEMERERDELLEKSERLAWLQSSFVNIVKADDERGLAVAALRGACLGLGFSRALWFRIDEEQEVTAIYELDGDEVVESEYGGTLPPESSLYRITSSRSNAAAGRSDDPDAPLFDTRRCYAAAAIAVEKGSSYLLYADGSPKRIDLGWSHRSVEALATHATFALERMRMAEAMEKLAMHDPLTGILNRRALMEKLAAEMATVRRTGESLAFAMIDVDDFKRINDTRGHAGGDEALKAIAGILQSQTRETDTVARFAGDEFSLIMPRSDEAGIAVVMKRVYNELHARGLSCSIGVAFATAAMSRDQLIERADGAVYKAKADGKDCYRLAG